MPANCTAIHYYQQAEWDESVDTTNQIMRAIQQATPVFLSGLIVLGIALFFSIIGYTKRDHKSMLAAVLYIFSALCLSGGVIVYISSVNVEVRHRKQLSRGSNSFHYQYGWAFFFAGSTFVANLVSAVANISVYLSKYSHKEEPVPMDDVGIEAQLNGTQTFNEEE